ncbi:hypothetical protein O6H91_15G043700 [Diphasiastrum complanatum]|uniref:Uncharacterized protein n=2 Tax=Diphasiastrum complanatum TaxID=34168 RepID=A0ACC2BHU7_DIPCM|nr:hypothetical protein O6H91_15G041700 [Diphasiastrum complanatum]KAJ7529309.1 hypothetical protein O6H91_15G043700 [Diphasiastrum complanatum]
MVAFWANVGVHFKFEITVLSDPDSNQQLKSQNLNIQISGHSFQPNFRRANGTSPITCLRTAAHQLLESFKSSLEVQVPWNIDCLHCTKYLCTLCSLVINFGSGC